MTTYRVFLAAEVITILRACSRREQPSRGWRRSLRKILTGKEITLSQIRSGDQCRFWLPEAMRSISGLTTPLKRSKLWTSSQPDA